MSRIIIMGGSVAGLLTGMQLARAGHDVTVLERESLAAVAAADTPAASRPGAPHAVHGHALLSRAAVEIRRALPEVYAALVSAGVGVFDLVAAMPATIADRTPRAGDHELVMLQSRRQSFDRVLVDVALTTPRLELRFDTAAAGLLFAQGGSSPPRVTGVRISNHGTLNADVVIDASGRRTPVPAWLAAAGVELPLEVWDCGLIYFTRHYRVRPGAARPPLNRVFAAGGQLASWRVSWFPGDNDTAMLVHTILAEDQLLKSVRRVECFEAVACAVPSIAAWHECSEPISEVFAMGALQTRSEGSCATVSRWCWGSIWSVMPPARPIRCSGAGFHSRRCRPPTWSGQSPMRRTIRRRRRFASPLLSSRRSSLGSAKTRSTIG